MCAVCVVVVVVVARARTRRVEATRDAIARDRARVVHVVVPRVVDASDDVAVDASR